MLKNTLSTTFCIKSEIRTDLIERREGDSHTERFVS